MKNPFKQRFKTRLTELSLLKGYYHVEYRMVNSFGIGSDWKEIKTRNLSYYFVYTENQRFSNNEESIFNSQKALAIYGIVNSLEDVKNVNKLLSYHYQDLSEYEIVSSDGYCLVFNGSNYKINGLQKGFMSIISNTWN